MQEYVSEVLDGDLPYLAENLREEDKREIDAMTGNDPLLSLQLGTKLCPHTKVIRIYGEPCGIFGYGPYTGSGYYIWMVATPSLETHKIKFLRYCKEGIAEAFRETNATYFFNYTHAPNNVHHKWLKWCGAKFLNPVPVGHKAELFFPFIITKEAYNV